MRTSENLAHEPILGASAPRAKLRYALPPQPGGFEGSVAISEVPDRSDLSLAYGDHGADGLIDFEATALAANCVTTLDEDLIPAEVRGTGSTQYSPSMRSMSWK